MYCVALILDFTLQYVVYCEFFLSINSKKIRAMQHNAESKLH
jgi:hypothetical protein